MSIEAKVCEIHVAFTTIQRKFFNNCLMLVMLKKEKKKKNEKALVFLSPR